MKDVLSVVSVGLVSIGLWLVYVPLCLIFLGVVCGQIAYNLTTTKEAE